MIQMSILGQQRVFVGLFSMAVLSAALPPFDTFEVNDRFGSRLCKNARWAAPCDEVLGLDCFAAGIFGLAVLGG
jgi:hypothetical protein